MTSPSEAAGAAAAMLAWLVVEKVRDGHSTSLGAASGVVAGLVAITPACAAVSPIGAIIVGLVAGPVGLAGFQYASLLIGGVTTIGASLDAHWSTRAQAAATSGTLTGS